MADRQQGGEGRRFRVSSTRRGSSRSAAGHRNRRNVGAIRALRGWIWCAEGGSGVTDVVDKADDVLSDAAGLARGEDSYGEGSVFDADAVESPGVWGGVLGGHAVAGAVGGDEGLPLGG